MGRTRQTLRPDIPFDFSFPRLEKEFVEIGLSQGWGNTDAPLILAVSGGSDSIAMLWMFSMFRKRDLVVAHLEHGIRGEEGKEDARFVISMADQLGIRCICKSLSVPDLLQKGESLEDGARRIRYGFLEETRKAEGAWGIAVAHTSDDSAETFLHNLFRGTGVRGLAGIPEKRGRIFRPMLKYSRSFLRELLGYYGVRWREDSTNDDTAYMRNRIRNVLLPLVEKEINGSARKHLLGTAGDLSFYRSLEEKIQESLLRIASVSLPFCSYACHFSFLRRLDGETASIFLRGTGSLLGLNTLSREKTDSLLRLVKTDRPWCFQWQHNMFVFSSSPFVTWVDPVILNRLESSGKEIQLQGDQGIFTWNGWFFSWEREKSTFFSEGWMQSVLPSTGELRVFSLSDIKKHRGVWAPHWGRHLFPVICSGSSDWIPFLGKRKTTRSNAMQEDAIRILARFPKPDSEKRQKNGL